jgi:hypothetical protein
VVRVCPIATRRSAVAGHTAQSMRRAAISTTFEGARHCPDQQDYEPPLVRSPWACAFLLRFSLLCWRFMVEIREIPNDELPPEDVDCVLIEKSGSKFVAKGSVGAPRSPTFYTPPAFPALEAAIEASMSWADLNDVPVIYIKGLVDTHRS